MMWRLCKPLVTISQRNLTRTTVLPAHFLSVRVATLLYKVNSTSRITCMNKLETDSILTSLALSLSRVVSHSYIQAFCFQLWYAVTPYLVLLKRNITLTCFLTLDQSLIEGAWHPVCLLVFSQFIARWIFSCR